MTAKIRTTGIDVAGIAADEIADPAPSYAAPKLASLGDATALVRGGGGSSGNDCRYYRLYISGPYGC
jgi:hypothetical protein